MKKIPGEHNNSVADDTFEAYLRRGSYERLEASHKSYETILDIVASSDPATVIAIDGPSNAGKTSLTKALVARYEAYGIPISLVPLDYFLTDRETRNGIVQDVASESLTIDGYSDVAWEQDRYRESIKRAKEIALQATEGIGVLSIDNAYNRLTGKKDSDHSIPIQAGGIILTEGVGIHAYHDDLFDIRIRVDTHHPDTLLKRVLGREREKPNNAQQPEDYLRRRYDLIDAPHTSHLRTKSPEVDYVLDTSDFEAMTLYRRR